MSDDNRYRSRSDEPLAFDARRARGGEGRSRGGVLIVSGAVLIILIAAFVIFTLNRVGGSSEEETAPVYDAMKSSAEPAAPVTTDETPGMVVQPVESLPPDQSAPAPEQVASAAPSPTPAPTAPAPAPTPAPKPAPTPAPKPAPAASSSAMVQIGAFSSRALAENQWNDIAVGMPAQMAGKTRSIEPVQSDSGTSYRALIGGFDSRAQAEAFCAALKAGGRDCFVRS